MTSTKLYNDRADEYIKQYEALRFEAVHKALLDYVPVQPAVVLDVGAGSGRDAAWFAERGDNVVAVEPATKLRELAMIKHPSAKIRWLDDRLPALKATQELGQLFDFILLSAVWMHVPESQRKQAFANLIAMLKPGGYMAMSLRFGSADAARCMFPVSVIEIQQFAKSFGVGIIKEVNTEDLLSRKEVSWTVVVLRRPDHLKE